MSKRKQTNIALGIVLILFFFLKWNVLVLPYFWDEAWSYITAIYQMANNGPCFWPGCIDVELYRGHPMFFYFIASIWMKVTGGLQMSMHIFSICISMLALLSLFRLAKVYVNPFWALMAVVVMLLQEVFFVQASFVLPEILLMLLLTEAIYHFVSSHKRSFILFASLLCLTKETGLIVLLGFIVFHFWEKKRFNKGSIWVFVPLLPTAVFFIVQKIRFGWLFFPLHVSMADLSLSKTTANGKLMLDFLFLEQGRSFMLIAVLLLLIWRIIETRSEQNLFVKLIPLVSGIGLLFIAPRFGVVLSLFLISTYFWSMVTKTDEKDSLVRLCFILFFITAAFCTVNFLMLRYLIILLPLLIIPMVMLTESVVSRSQIKTIAFTSIVSLVFLGSMLYNYKTRSWHDDVSLNYSNVVKVHRDLIAYCEGKSWYQRKIHTQFLLQQNMSHPELGYIRVRSFEAVEFKTYDSLEREIIIFSNIELDEPKYNAIKTNPNYHLDRRFAYHKAWGEIYIRR